MPRLARLLSIAIIAVACAPAGAAIDSAPSPTIEATPITTATPPQAQAPPTSQVTATPISYGGFDQVLSRDQSLAIMVKGELRAHESRDRSSPAVVVPATTILGTSTVANVVEGPVDGWVRIGLPMRPNGSTGWVELDSVELYAVEGRIVIDLSDRELILYRDGQEILRTSTAVGTSRNPTPTGEFYVTDRVRLANPNSPWGPYALGLSARSDTITEYNGGDGIIGIHGTNRPGSIGNAASLGCVRLSNEAITQLYELVVIGTPVEIRG